jgi:hypothetical protein
MSTFVHISAQSGESAAGTEADSLADGTGGWTDGCGSVR